MTEQTETTAPLLRVRPYTVTGGRTSASVQLEIETMIKRVDGRAVDGGLVPESRSIVDLCHQPLSIAEISAHLHLPLQVVKVLTGDLMTAGLVASHNPTAQPNGRPDLALLERVLEGLQSL